MPTLPTQNFFHCSPEGRRMDRRIAVQKRLDLIKGAANGFWIDQVSAKHRTDILQILTMTPFNLGEGLSVEVIVVKIQVAFPADREAAILPSPKFRDE
ncbi:MAG: hypothetical protein HYZ90_01690, partial [Candidatus Omnitrophica bacterium]|nr:hypothetical protein [Candidatus Omnitrophota bacterium]